MNTIQHLVRKNIIKMQPYLSARLEYTGEEAIFLDANESPNGQLNRYPDPNQQALKNKLSEIKKVPTDNIFIGNGSDEVIDLACRIFCEPGLDKVLLLTPTYGMYQVSANINNVEVISVPLKSDCQIDFDIINKHFDDKQLKLIFICSPNNPTGNIINDIEIVLQQFKGIVFVDEAYIEFSENNSYLQKIMAYSNLIVSQTLSKAWAHAAIRVGTAYASKEIIALYNKIKPPYNISTLNQNEALKALCEIDIFNKNKKEILFQREILQKELSALPFVIRTYKSDSNFILIEVTNANSLYTYLVNAGVIVRNRHTTINNCLRITIGNPNQNMLLIKALHKYKSIA